MPRINGRFLQKNEEITKKSIIFEPKYSFDKIIYQTYTTIMTITDKIRGAIVGFALGDALGVGTEFMTKREVDAYYPGGLRHFNQIIRDAHRIQWKPGEWTNDTEIAIRLIECIISEDGFDIIKIAKKFKEWYDGAICDVAPVYRVVCENPQWLKRPIVMAHREWQSNGTFEASNEAIQRAMVAGLTSSEEDIAEHTRKLILMTHSDSRCVSSAIILAYMFHSLLHTGEEKDYKELEDICVNIDTRTLPYLKMARDGEIERLEIDDEDTWSWTRKAMASGLWGFWYSDNPADALYKVVDLGGDGDTNASISCALSGLKYGYDALPDEKLKLSDLDRLLTLSDCLAEYLHRKSL